MAMILRRRRAPRGGSGFEPPLAVRNEKTARAMPKLEYHSRVETGPAPAKGRDRTKRAASPSESLRHDPKMIRFWKRKIALKPVPA